MGIISSFLSNLNLSNLFSNCYKSSSDEEDNEKYLNKNINDIVLNINENNCQLKEEERNKIEELLKENENKILEEKILKKKEELNDKEKKLNDEVNKKNKEFEEREKEMKNEIEKKEKELKEKEEKLYNDIANREKKLEEKEKKLNIEIANKEKENKENKEKEIKEKEEKLNNHITKKEKEIKEKEEKLNIDIANKEKDIKEKEEILKMNLINLEKEKNEIKKEKENNKKEKEEIETEKNDIKNDKEFIKKEKENLQKNKDDIEKEKKNIQKEKDDIIKEKQKIQTTQEFFKKIRKEFQKERENFEKEKELEKTPILVGLNNIGATCYMNATLQALSNTDKLTNYFLTQFVYDPENQQKIMSNEFYKLLTHLHDKNNMNKAYSPDDFKTVLSSQNPLFQGIQACDSKDLINFLIETFHRELNAIQNPQNNNYNVNQLNENEVLQNFLNDFQTNYSSIISDLFYGVLETKTKCLGCKNTKYNFQIYSFLEFPLEQINNYFSQNGKRNLINNNGTNPDIDLYECFDYYQKMDFMNGDNQMYCNICNSLQNALYGCLLYSGPQYLIINLNRGRNAVYECKVIFPELLNILNYVTFKEGITVYKLYAVICHYGPSSMDGHFMAYCRNEKDNNWYLYNDAFVSKCTKIGQYNEGMPYILFYKSV